MFDLYKKPHFFLKWGFSEMLNLFRDYARSRTPAAIVAFPVEPTIMIPWLAVVPSKVAY